MPTEVVPRWRSLRAKLAAFLLLFSIPALLLVEIAVLSFEYWEVVSRFQRGALQQQAQLLARELYPYMDHPPEELRLRLNNARLQLQDPRSTWLGEPFVLSELSDQPIRITLRRADGSLWIAALVAAAVPEPGARVWRGESGIEGASEFVRIEIALSAPWRRVESAFSFEWPVMVACLTLVGLGAGVFLHRVVLRRLERIAAAAEGWSRERFSLLLKDQSADEIGALTRRLNRVASALRERINERVRLAGLEERERLAQDLHDSVKQHGFALELQLGALAASLPPGSLAPESKAGMALIEAQTLSKQIRSDLDVILGELRSDDFGDDLSALLERRVRDFIRRSGMRCELHISGIESTLSLVQREELLKIVDESLANIWRHASGSAARIELNRRADGAGELRVSNDGIGFDLALALEKPTMGLKNLTERARRLPAGALKIDTHPGGPGTRIELTWQEQV